MRRPAGIFGLVWMLLRARRRSWRDAATTSRRAVLPLVLALAVIGLLFAEVRWLGSSPEPTFTARVDEVVAAPERFRGKRSRVEGEVCGPVERSVATPCLHRFVMTSAQGVSVLPVHLSTCVLPDAMKREGGDLTVSVEGELTASGVFAATRVLVRCPSKYDPERAQRPRRACPS